MILSSLVFGKHVYPKDVYTKGITDVSLKDVKIAQKSGYAVKLIASVKKLESGKILPMVSPMLVPYDNLISRVDDVFNAVMVCGDGIDRAMFYGRGAGMLPTASAVLGDVIEELKTEGTTDVAQTWADSCDTTHLADHNESICRMYFRISSPVDISGIKVIEKNDGFAFITEKMSFGDAMLLAQRFKDDGNDVKSVLPVLDI